MKLIDTFDSIKHPSVLTPWSIIHFATGITSRSLSLTARSTLCWWHALYECKDLFFSYVMRKNLNPNLPKDEIQNSIYNSIGDQIVFTLGTGIETDKQTAILIQLAAFLILASPLCSPLSSSSSFDLDVWYKRG